MHPFVHGDQAVAAAFRPNGRRSACDDGFDAAQRLALDDWRMWDADQGEDAALSELARSVHLPSRSSFTAALIGWLRQAIGLALVAAGRRVQGTAMPDTTPDAGGSAAA